MSAPTSIDAAAMIGGVAVRRHGLVAVTSHHAPIPGDRRSTDRIAKLTREFNDLCTQAVDPAEIAAGLEAKGVTDQRARRQFGVASVFELAELMFHAVPRRPTARAERPDPWLKHPGRHLLRGLLYGLPGVPYVAALHNSTGDAATIMLLVSTITACALGQTVSFLGHVLIGRLERHAARRLFRTALVIGALVAAVPASLTLTDRITLPVGLGSAALIEYVVAATCLLIVDADLILLAALAPVVVAAVVGLCGGLDHLPVAAVAGGAGGWVLLVVIAAWTRLAPQEGDSVRGLRTALTGAEVPVSATYFAYGAMSLGLMSFAPLDQLTGSIAAGQSASVGLTMAPLMLSLGVGDLLQHRLRSRAGKVLASASSTQEFAARARTQLGVAIMLYAGLLSAMTCLLLVALGIDGRHLTVLGLDMGGYSLLGVGLFLCTILLASGLNLWVLLIVAGSLLVDSVMRLVMRDRGDAVALATGHLAVFGALTLVLLAVSMMEFGRLARHQ